MAFLTPGLRRVESVPLSQVIRTARSRPDLTARLYVQDTWVDQNRDKFSCQKPPDQIVVMPTQTNSELTATIHVFQNLNKHITKVLEEMSEAAAHDLGRHVNENTWRKYAYKKVLQPF